MGIAGKGTRVGKEHMEHVDHEKTGESQDC